MATPKKRLFIGLIAGSCVLLGLALVVLWVVPYVGLDNIHPWLKWIWGAVLGAVMLLIGWAALGLVVNVWTGRPMPGTGRLRGITVKLFLPLMVLLGKAVGISKERVRSSFINVNNEMVLSGTGRYRPDQILLLMPHCLQNSRCDMRLTYDINNCKRCGKCPLKGLLELHDKYGVHLAIATGGTVARRIVVQKRPRMIIAVACERDLSSGIQDTYPLPVYGVLNERPNGPCLDTTVSLFRVEQAILRFLDPAYLPGAASADGKGRGQAISTAGSARS
ncbi:hypothetical protein SAMN02745704_02715 [Paucidesulfovibrio gracilis DSM 16080]|uniref:DUF116 domain-containing protein n=1 Tax=Paucidesulfovibrio gracilis DSM 16080 TaxID=1121449 RepID=A0A1T4Y3E2_9BACT|nr:DUF116 domain-containing protein [Paucidesulfovibrio gracilis]SKA96322.1 hypothetical protein SAMN02745704_02715 [Paucidesulfovibrio gracilis DSM 16080]